MATGDGPEPKVGDDEEEEDRDRDDDEEDDDDEEEDEKEEEEVADPAVPNPNPRKAPEDLLLRDLVRLPAFAHDKGEDGRGPFARAAGVWARGLR